MMYEEGSHEGGRGEEFAPLRAWAVELEHRLRGVGPAPRSANSRVPGGVLDVNASAAERAIAGLFDQPRVMLFIADLVEGRFLWLNDTVSDVLGIPAREILESSFLDRIHPDDLSRTMLEMGRLAAGEPTLDFRNRYRHADGTYRVFEWAATADAEGELCFAAAVEIIE